MDLLFCKSKNKMPKKEKELKLLAQLFSISVIRKFYSPSL